MPTLRHITFASGLYEASARALKRDARRWSLSTTVYSPSHPAVRALRRRHPRIMSATRGAGYWLWKPAIILDAMEKSAADDLILYTDAGMSFVADPHLLAAVAEVSPIGLFEHDEPNAAPATYAMRRWTKRDCFILLGADRPAIWESRQVLGGFQIYRNCDASRVFLHELLEAMSDARTLTDLPNTLGAENLPGFVAHRHDQAVLSILAYKHGLPRWPDPSQYGPCEPGPARVLDDGLPRPAAPYGQVVDLHRRTALPWRTRVRSAARATLRLPGRILRWLAGVPGGGR